MKETNRAVAALGYILFFIPLLVDGNNEEYKFHANQGLVLLIVSLIVNIIPRFIPWIGLIIALIGGILVLVLCIMGIINALNGEQKELPIIGSFTLIK